MSIIAKSSDIIDFPQNYTAYIFGTAATTCIWVQDVKVKVQNADADDEAECTFRAVNTPLVVTDGGLGFLNQEAVVISSGSVNRKIEIIFKVFKNNVPVGDPVDVKGFYKDAHSPGAIDSVTNYTYRTEDGGDNDYHDTTVVISLVRTTK